MLSLEAQMQGKSPGEGAKSPGDTFLPANACRAPEPKIVDWLKDKVTETRIENHLVRPSHANSGEECRLLRAELHVARERLAKLQEIVDGGQQDSQGCRSFSARRVLSTHEICAKTIKLWLRRHP